MPQMMPLMWMMIFIFMIFYSFFLMSMIYFLFLPSPLIMSHLCPVTPPKWYWKW